MQESERKTIQQHILLFSLSLPLFFHLSLSLSHHHPSSLTLFPLFLSRSLPLPFIMEASCASIRTQLPPCDPWTTFISTIYSRCVNFFILFIKVFSRRWSISIPCVSSLPITSKRLAKICMNSIEV